MEHDEEKKKADKEFHIKLRDYQERLFHQCLKKNVIICLPTGSGKTMIAIMVMKHFLKQTQGPYPKHAKRTFFLAPKRTLVIQQYRVIKNMIPAKVLIMTGDDEPEKFDKRQWMKHLEENQIFVFTPDILLDILLKGYIQIKNINVIVFDEMHWAFKNGTQPSNHPYTRIMVECQRQTKEIPRNHHPRILALSASLFSNFAPNILENTDSSLKNVERLYQAKIESGCFSYSQNFQQHLIPYEENEIPIDIGFNFSKLIGIFAEFSNKSYLKQFQLVFRKIHALMTKEMGIWFALEFVKLACKSLQREHLKDAQCHEIMWKIMRFIQKCMGHWIKIKSFKKNDIRLLEKIYISDKLLVLLGIIRKIKKANLASQSFTGILFVAERIDACLIYRWLKKLSEIDEEFGFLRPGFICGSLKKDFLSFDHIYNNWDFLKKVRNEDINFIVATSVLEEGIDIPVCNVVIRHDGIENYRAFCQSRGRARSEQSQFFVMTPLQDYKKCAKKMENYEKMDRLLSTIQSPDFIEVFEENVSLSKKEEDMLEVEKEMEDDKNFLRIKPFINGNSRLYPRESLQLLNRYFTQLPKDLFTEQRMPFLTFEEYFDGSVRKYATIFLFPINSPHNGIVIKGAFFTNQKNAASHSAFRACKFLIDNHDIDENLNVARQKFILQKHAKELNIRYVPQDKPLDETNSDGDDDDDDDDKNDGGSRRGLEKEFQTKIHVNKTSDYFQECFDENSSGGNNNYHLYAIEFYGTFDPSKLSEDQLQQLFKPVFVTNSVDQSEESAHKHDQTVGILLSNQHSLDFIQSYFFFNLFPIKFHLKFCGTIDLNQDESRSEQIHFFHRHVTMMVFQKFQFDENSLLDSGLLIVPMKTNTVASCGDGGPPYSIDFNTIQTLQDWIRSYEDSNQNTEKVAKDNLKLDQIKPYDPEANFNNYGFTIFSCIHQKSMQLYFAKNITDRTCQDFMIQPKEEQPGVTYAQFYQSKYDRIIRDSDVPMINTGMVNIFQINYYLYRVKCTVLRKFKPVTTVFPLEFISVYPLSSVMYLRIASLPMLLYRLEQYFLGKEYLHSLAHCIDLNYQIDKFNIDDILFKQKTIRRVVPDQDVYGEAELMNIDTIMEDPSHQKLSAPELEAFDTFIENEKSKRTILDDDDDDDEVGPFNQPEQDKLFEELKSLCQKIGQTKQNNKDWRDGYQNQTETIEFGNVSMFKFTGDIDECIRKENLKFNTFNQHDCPNPWQIVQGLTLAKANDAWNIERLECIGDSFIKFTCCLYLFFKYPEYNVMKFDSLKQSLINNKNLFKIAVEKDIPKYIFCSLHQSIPMNFFKSLLARNYETKSEYRPLLRYKDVADCVESLIGVFLVYGGAGTALDFLNKYLDLKSFDPNQHDDTLAVFLAEKMNPKLNVLGPSIDMDDYKFDELKDSKILNKLGNKLTKEAMQNEIDKYYNEQSMYLLEEEIDYKFNDKFLLVQAFTHPSMFKSEDPETGEFVYNFVPSYQRLEFIGDATLDYLLTRYIYQKDSSLDPTDITNIRQALVNNTFYASIAVKHGLHKYLRHTSFALQNCMHKFVKRFAFIYIEQVEALLVDSIDEDEAMDLNNVDVPKTLADIFESLIGAIFVDCHFDFDKTWRVVFRMIKMEIEHFVKHVPLMPLNRLAQHYHNCRFGKCEILDLDRASKRKIELNVNGVGTFVGHGRSKRQCKVAAAKRFFAYEKKMAQAQAENVPA